MPNRQVIFISGWVVNPYQRLYVAQLRRLGLCVLEWDLRLASLSRAIWRGSGTVHLHMIERLFLYQRRRSGRVARLACVVAALAILRARGTRIFLTLHELESHENVHPWLQRHAMKILARLANGLFVHSEATRDDAMALWGSQLGDKLIVIPHGTYQEAYGPPIEPAAARAALKLSPTHRVFLFFGWISPYKGLIEFVTLFKELAGNDCILVIAGQPTTPQLAGQLRDLSEGDPRLRVLANRVPDAEVAALFSAADVVVLPYLRIATSGVAMLGLSMGKACLAPRIGCLRSVLDDAGSFLHDPGEAGAKKALQCALAADAARLAEMGRHNLARAANYRWEEAASLTQQAYLRKS